MLAFSVVVLWLAVAANAFYLPGIAPKDYAEGDPITVMVNRLSSTSFDPKTGRESTVFSYDYYLPEFHFCKPEGGPQAKSESLGAVLFGDRIFTSPMQLEVLKDVECQHLCTASYPTEHAKFVKKAVFEGFQHHWTVDGIPVSERVEEYMPEYYDAFWMGYPLFDDGSNDMGVQLANHFEFTIEYNDVRDQKVNIVGASVRPHAVKNLEKNGTHFKCAKGPAGAFGPGEDDYEKKVTFSYSVKWTKSHTKWANRWNKYLTVHEAKINWFALANTTSLIFFMVCLTAVTLLRLVRKDIAKYNEVDVSGDIGDEIGWKLVHGDVFRPPNHVMAYSVAIGTGFQIISTLVGTIFLALMGFLSPANPGSFGTVLLMLNTLLGALGGYVSAAAYKIWGGKNWKSNLVLTPVVVPALVFLLFLCLNFLLVFHQASGAVPIGNMAALIAIWGLISVPLSLVCGFFAFKREWYEAPVRVNQIPRQIPPQPVIHRLPFMMAACGILPFLAVSLQLYYVMTAIWKQQLYYMFGFLFASLVAAILLCITVTTLAVYFTLCSENYHWQWRSFMVSGSPAIYVFLYSLLYMYRYVKPAQFSGKMLYIGYSFMASALCFLALGTVGAATSFFLVRRIYSSIKVE